MASRLRALLIRAEQTDTPGQHEFYQYQEILKQRSEALQMLREYSAMYEALLKFSTTLKSHAFETASAAVKARIGNDWTERFKDFERREAVGELVRELRKLIMWVAHQEAKAKTGGAS